MKVTVKNMSDYTKPNEELSEGENPKKKQIGFWCEIDNTDGADSFIGQTYGVDAYLELDAVEGKTVAEQVEMAYAAKKDVVDAWLTKKKESLVGITLNPSSGKVE